MKIIFFSLLLFFASGLTVEQIRDQIQESFPSEPIWVVAGRGYHISFDIGQTGSEIKGREYDIYRLGQKSGCTGNKDLRKTVRNLAETSAAMSRDNRELYIRQHLRKKYNCLFHILLQREARFATANIKQWVKIQNFGDDVVVMLT